jgi:hypothetical protein
MIHHANGNLYLPLELADVEYGILISKLLTNWKLDILSGLVVSGQFHAHCEIFKKAIKSVSRIKGKNPTFKNLSHRRIEIKNWNKNYAQSIIEVLIDRNEIVIKEKRGKPCYYILK